MTTPAKQSSLHSCIILDHTSVIRTCIGFNFLLSIKLQFLSPAIIEADIFSALACGIFLSSPKKAAQHMKDSGKYCYIKHCGNLISFQRVHTTASESQVQILMLACTI